MVALTAPLWSSDDMAFPSRRGVSKAVRFRPDAWAGLLPSGAHRTARAVSVLRALGLRVRVLTAVRAPVPPAFSGAGGAAFLAEQEKAQLRSQIPVLSKD